MCVDHFVLIFVSIICVVKLEFICYEGHEDCPGGIDENQEKCQVGRCGKPAVTPKTYGQYNGPLLKSRRKEGIGTRIVSGEESVPHSWPWQIALLSVKEGRQTCGGSIVRLKVYGTKYSACRK